MKDAALIVALVLAGGVLWLAGEQHRGNCQRDGKVACSVLPWESGESPKPPKPVDVSKMAPAERIPYCAALRAAGEPLPRGC